MQDSSHLQSLFNAELSIRPVWGRKKTRLINRTSMDIVSSASKVDVGNVMIELPALKNDDFHLRLEMLDPSNNDSSYKLRSLNRRPYLLNGHQVFDALIEIGDTCLIGHNEINFQRPKDCEVSLNPMIDREIVKSDIPIMIQGETGTGKSFLAKQVHEASGVRGEFVHLNLSAFSAGTLESELFGHVKGAFTGANNDNLGAFRQAREGTLFLDEIDSVPLEIQTKLLLFLDDNKLRPVGGTQEYTVNCRMIFAAGQSLQHLISKGKMRKDFYYRMNSGHFIKLNPLRENPAELKRFCISYLSQLKKQIDPDLLKYYCERSWPGNYRQLKAHLRHKVILSKSSKLVFDSYDEKLATEMSEVAMSQEDHYLTLKEVKEKYMLNIYYKSERDVTLTSNRLGISKRSIRNLLTEKGLRS